MGFFVSFIFIVRVDTVTGEVNALVISASWLLFAGVREQEPQS